MELSAVKQVTHIGIAEKLVAFDFFHTGEVITAVQFIIAKGKWVQGQNEPEVIPVYKNICYDIVTKKLR